MLNIPSEWKNLNDTPLVISKSVGLPCHLFVVVSFVDVWKCKSQYIVLQPLPPKTNITPASYPKGSFGKRNKGELIPELNLG